MSASDLRRGPGWWMDLDGEWNPPELWPESSPPLPGWNRSDDGTWIAPLEESADEGPVPETSDAAPAPDLFVTDSKAVEPTTTNRNRLIGYADHAPPAPPRERYQPSVEAALAAAVAAAVTAAAIATGLILLIMVL